MTWTPTVILSQQVGGGPMFCHRIQHSIGLLAAWLLVTSVFSGAYGQAVPAGIRSQFTDSQWQALQSVRYTPLILPANVPRGYRVSRVAVDRPDPKLTDPKAESYHVVYSNGRHIIVWFGTNWTAGGDADTASFRVTYNSPLFGKGEVSMSHDIDNGYDKQKDCWVAWSLNNRGDTSFFSFYTPRGGRGGAFSLEACDPGLSPREVALMMQTTVLLKQNFVPE